jgi:hypothetical protein
VKEEGARHHIRNMDFLHDKRFLLSFLAPEPSGANWIAWYKEAMVAVKEYFECAAR